YVGGPRNYKWIDTNPLPKVWDQLSLAAAYGADRVWIVNVGHFKGYERPMEFFLRMAWAPSRWGPDGAEEFTRLWAEREFGPENATEAARLAGLLAKLNGRRKPEMLEPGTYSLVNYREADRVVAEYASLAAEARSLQARLDPARRDAFYEMVAFPAKATSIVNALYVAAAKNALYARQGRAGAGAMAREVRRLFQEDRDLMRFYNTSFAGGRWAHFMDQPHIGYSGWNDPPADNLGQLRLVEPLAPRGARLGVAVEGSDEVWPGAKAPPALRRFDSINRQEQYFEVFDRGDEPFDYTIQSSRPWIVVGETGGTAGPADRRHLARIDWAAAPAGDSRGSILIAGARESVEVGIEILKPPDLSRETLRGFVENQGAVSIEPEHFSARADQPHSRWIRIADYGRTLSGMRADGPADEPPAEPGVNAACLEYRFLLFEAAPVSVMAVTGPTLNFAPGRPLRYAIAIDDEAPRLVTAVPADFSVMTHGREWEGTAADNARLVRTEHPAIATGSHILKVWAIDPGVVLQKLIIDAGGLKPSYLGSPESLILPEAR
ncbi:MAG TPA: glycosyl hydrolase 115 family protein, partial [Acidimicrobiales bacterium]|nr:glycosyl hydrolase 115 family protein [Acidimicrobiales bacterium]